MPACIDSTATQATRADDASKTAIYVDASVGIPADADAVYCIRDAAATSTAYSGLDDVGINAHYIPDDDTNANAWISRVVDQAVAHRMRYWKSRCFQDASSAMQAEPVTVEETE